MQRHNHIEPVAVFKAQVHHRIGWLAGTRQRLAVGHGFGNRHLEAAPFHRAAEPREKRLVIVNEQQRALFARARFALSCRFRSAHSALLTFCPILCRALTR
jgi:hypothetical protein